MMEVSHNQFNNPNHPEVVMQRHSLDPLRGVVVDNYSITSESWVQSTDENSKTLLQTFSLPPRFTYVEAE